MILDDGVKHSCARQNSDAGLDHTYITTCVYNINGLEGNQWEMYTGCCQLILLELSMGQCKQRGVRQDMKKHRSFILQTTASNAQCSFKSNSEQTDKNRTWRCKINRLCPLVAQQLRTPHGKSSTAFLVFPKT